MNWIKKVFHEHDFKEVKRVQSESCTVFSKVLRVCECGERQVLTQITAPTDLANIKL